MLPKSDQDLHDAIVGKPGPAQRRAIATAITLLESSRADHRARADELLNALLPASGKAFRLGISGVPGVGKSTFIETLGLHLVGHGHRVAVLAVDPSSSVSGGSILGDKTRMERLSVHERAYIRPTPAGRTLGGVAEATRESIAEALRPGTRICAYSIRLAEATRASTTLATPRRSISATVRTAKTSP